MPEAAEAQSASSERGGGSSFGRISGGGGSYGHLTHGFTANRPSARIPINALTRANGTANQPRRGRTERVPINAQTMANGRANAWKEPPDDPAQGKKPVHDPPRRGPFLVDGRSYYQYVLASQAMAPYVLAPEEDPTERRRRLGRVPAPDPEAAEPRGTAADAPETETAQPMAPRVKPPIPADPAAADEALPADQCAVVRVRTVGGIQWRQRIRVGEYGASTPEEAADALQEVLKRSEPLSIRGPDGSFTVRPTLVQSLIVGPCRGF